MIDQIFRDEREQKILHDAMKKLDMSAEAVTRRWCRLGQLVDYQMQQGYKLAWIKNGELVDPLASNKMAPADFSRWGDEGGATPAQLSCGCDVGSCICNYEKD